jgi:hypothetical protein
MIAGDERTPEPVPSLVDGVVHTMNELTASVCRSIKPLEESNSL